MERRDREEGRTVVRPQMRMNGVSGEERTQTITAEVLMVKWWNISSMTHSDAMT